MSNWKTEIEHEFERAEAARRQGNAGRARVCARRAAGIAIGEYLRRQNIPSPGQSAIARLRLLRELPQVSGRAHQVCDHLLLRVTPDHELPVPVDLVAEASWLVQELLEA